MRPRKPLKRSTKPISRSPLKRSSRPPRARKADPTKRRFAGRRCRPYLDWLQREACCVTGWRSDVEGFGVDPAHIRPRSTGGDDLYNALPLIRRLHDKQHVIGWPEFEKWYGIDAKAIAKEHTERFFAEHPEVAARYPKETKR